MKKTGPLRDFVDPVRLGAGHTRLRIEQWDAPDDYVIVIDGKPEGQALPHDKAVEIAVWLSTVINTLRPLR